MQQWWCEGNVREREREKKHDVLSRGRGWENALPLSVSPDLSAPSWTASVAAVERVREGQKSSQTPTRRATPWPPTCPHHAAEPCTALKAKQGTREKANTRINQVCCTPRCTFVVLSEPRGRNQTQVKKKKTELKNVCVAHSNHNDGDVTVQHYQ